MALGLPYQTRLFDELLKPYFEHGFQKRDNQGIYKIENGLVYVISFQFGRANNVNLHFFVNSTANIFTDIFHSNEFGKRLQGNEYSSKYWYIDEEKQFDEVVVSIKQSIKEIALPFFMKINSIERLYFHYLVQFQYTLLPFSAALLSAQLHENTECINYCERSINDIEKDEEFDIANNPEDNTIYNYLVTLKKAVEDGHVDDLIFIWKEQIKLQNNIIESIA